jgi:hypothetical protein
MNNLLKKAIAECIGTFVLVFVACGVAAFTGGDLVATSLAFGLVIVAMAYSIGRISGCHINPAVSLGCLLTKRMSVVEFLVYVLAQVVGGFLGAVALFGFAKLGGAALLGNACNYQVGWNGTDLTTGGIIACINAGTGVVETTGFDKLGRITDVHPDTHFTIKGIKIPRWRQLCDKAIEMSERLPTLRYIGWDFVYDKDKDWIVMEGNENAEINSPQLIYHRGMREEFEQLIGIKPTKDYWWQGKYPSRFENI